VSERRSLWADTSPVPRPARDAYERSPKQEAEAASLFGGRVTRGSGSGGYDKGDVKVGDLVVIENKTTKASSFRVTLEMLDKVANASLGKGSIPAMGVELELGARRCYVLEAWAFEMLMEAARKGQE
jgi:hypothetical protein